jgi:hypothetical protein
MDRSSPTTPAGNEAPSRRDIVGGPGTVCSREAAAPSEARRRTAQLTSASRAAVVIASMPVSSVGWITGATRGLWLVGMSSAIPRTTSRGVGRTLSSSAVCGRSACRRLRGPCRYAGNNPGRRQRGGKVDALPAAQALVAAVVALVPRHGLRGRQRPTRHHRHAARGVLFPATERRSRMGHANSARDALHIVCACRSSVRLTGASRSQLSRSRIRVARTRWAASVGAACAWARRPLCGAWRCLMSWSSARR